MAIHIITAFPVHQVQIPLNFLTQVFQIQIREVTLLHCYMIFTHTGPIHQHFTESVEMIVFNRHVMHVRQLVGDLARYGRVAASLIIQRLQ